MSVVKDKVKWFKKALYFAHMESLPRVCADMKLAMDENRGWSLLRLCDGEKMLLESLRLGKPVGCVATAWMNRYIPGTTWKHAAQALLDAVPKADCVGLAMLAHDHPNYAIHEELTKHGIDWTKLVITSGMIQLFIAHQSWRIQDLANGRRVGIAYRNPDVARAKFKKLGIDVITYAYEKNISNEETVAFFEGEACDLVFVCGGPFGKAMTVQLAAKGMVAFDLGQGLEKHL